MWVLEHQCGRVDVLLLHTLTAAQVDGVLYAFINLFGAGILVSRIGQLHQRAVCERRQDLGRLEFVIGSIRT